jgi:dinuclear metal center YbgI/SA1388 family protein
MREKMKLHEVCSFLDEYLQIADYQDVSNNGLQIEGRRRVKKVAFAVDACMESFRAAKRIDADMLVVHHGLIWGGIDYITGITKRRIEYLLKNEISLYAAHLPLDAHPEVGNNALIIKKAGGKPEKKFGEYKGIKIGYCCSLRKPVSIENLAGRMSSPEIRILLFGDDIVENVAAVSGKGGFAVREAVERNVDLLITGEAEHEVYHTAKEGQLNVLFLGHYESEKYGVIALSKLIQEKLGLEVEFIDIPTHL